jgi:ferrous iron transport protein B
MGQMGAVVAPALQPLGFGNWEAASALITGVIAKEIVVGTMGEIYISKAKDEPKEETPSLGQDVKEIAVSFGSAAKEAAGNVFSFGSGKFSTEEKEKSKPLKSVLHKSFTPLSAYAFMAFVLLYMPCMVVAVAMRHEFGSWKWFGVTFAYQMALAWLVALLIYQGGKLLGLG